LWSQGIPVDKKHFHSGQENLSGHRSAQQWAGKQRMSVATTLATLALAQPAAGGNSLTMLLPLLLIPVLYILMIRPQQKRQKQWQQMLADIKAGDRVTTAGGIRGVILSIKDDAVILRVAPDGIKMEVAKNAIAAVTTNESAAS